jgi:hypothetical protein
LLEMLRAIFRAFFQISWGIQSYDISQILPPVVYLIYLWGYWIPCGWHIPRIILALRRVLSGMFRAIFRAFFQISWGIQSHHTAQILPPVIYLIYLWGYWIPCGWHIPWIILGLRGVLSGMFRAIFRAFLQISWGIQSHHITTACNIFNISLRLLNSLWLTYTLDHLRP